MNELADTNPAINIATTKKTVLAMRATFCLNTVSVFFIVLRA